MRDSSNAALVSLVVDISGTGLEERMLQRRAVTGVRATGLPVAWGLGCREHADLLSECGPANKDEEAAFVLATGSPAGDRGEELRASCELPFVAGLTHGATGCEPTAKRLGVRVMIAPVVKGAPAAQVRSLASGLRLCTPNVEGAAPARGIWSLFGAGGGWDAEKLAATEGPSVVLVDGPALLAGGQKAVDRLVAKLERVVSLAATDRLLALPLGRFTEELAESTQSCPQRSILRAA